MTIILTSVTPLHKVTRGNVGFDSMQLGGDGYRINPEEASFILLPPAFFIAQQVGVLRALGKITKAQLSDHCFSNYIF